MTRAAKQNNNSQEVKVLASRKSLVLVLVSVLALSLLLGLLSCSESRATPSSSTGNANTVPNNVSAVQDSNSTQTYTSQPPKTETPQPPKREENTRIVRISNILTNPNVYKGQVVVVKGKIISECGAGCWFTLNDGTGTIYVDLRPSNLVIPQKRGATATVYGEVVCASGNTYIIGKKVEF